MLLYGLKVRGCCAALKPFVHVKFEFQKIAKSPKDSCSRRTGSALLVMPVHSLRSGSCDQTDVDKCVAAGC